MNINNVDHLNMVLDEIFKREEEAANDKYLAYWTLVDDVYEMGKDAEINPRKPRE